MGYDEGPWPHAHAPITWEWVGERAKKLVGIRIQVQFNKILS